MLQLSRSVRVVCFILHAVCYFYLIIKGACRRVPTQPGTRLARRWRLEIVRTAGGWPVWLSLFISFFNAGEH